MKINTDIDDIMNDDFMAVPDDTEDMQPAETPNSEIPSEDEWGTWEDSYNQLYDADTDISGSADAADENTDNPIPDIESAGDITAESTASSTPDVETAEETPETSDEQAAEPAENSDTDTADETAEEDIEPLYFTDEEDEVFIVPAHDEAEPGDEAVSDDTPEQSEPAEEAVHDDVMKNDIDTIKLATDFRDEYGNITVAEATNTQDRFDLKYIPVSDIHIPDVRIRKAESDALTQSIRHTGLLKPLEIVVMSDGKYMLVNGYKRFMSCISLGMKKVPCVINTKVNSKFIDILEPMYNQHDAYTNEEKRDFIERIRAAQSVPDVIFDDILQMHNGDCMKLFDVLADNDPKIVDKMLNDTYSISEAFKKLELRRKKENRDAQASQRAEKIYSGESEITNDLHNAGDIVNDDYKLTDDEKEEQLNRARNLREEIANDEDSEESLDELVADSKKMKGYEPHQQDYHNRERLAPELRKAVLARDNNTCQICRQISGQEYTEVLDVHHINEVYLGGTDDMDNLVTACTVCHKLVHLYARGDLHIRPESEMSDEEKAKFRRVTKMGNIIREGVAKKGMKKEDLKKMDKAETIGRTKKGSSGQVAG